MEERRSKTVFVVFFSIQMAKFLSNVVFGFQHCLLDYLGLLSTLVLLIGFLRTLKKYKKIGAEYFIWILWWSLVVFNGIGERLKEYCLGSVVLASLNDGFAYTGDIQIRKKGDKYFVYKSMGVAFVTEYDKFEVILNSDSTCFESITQPLTTLCYDGDRSFPTLEVTFYPNAPQEWCMQKNDVLQ